MSPDRSTVKFASPKRARAISNSETRPSEHPEIFESPDAKRHHSASVSSVASHMSDDYETFPRKPSHERDNIDLEKQLIISAGGNGASVCCFLMKILLLTTVVLGCGVLVFYAL
ncbi:hypothetical protein OXX80_006460 [Metschnikowia pulcherrima]